MKSSKGITLIALVITIIVLLILAGVSIALVTGNNGVLSQASISVKKTNEAEEKEQIEMAYLSAKSAKVENYFEEVTADELKNALAENGITEIKVEDTDEEGKLRITFFDNGNIYEIKSGVVTKIDDVQNYEDYSYIFEFDETTGTINGIKEEYIAKNEDGSLQYYNNIVDDNNGPSGYIGCVLVEDIDTLIVPSEIDGVKIKNVETIPVMNVRKIIFQSGIENIQGIYINFNAFEFDVSSMEVIAKESETIYNLKEIELPNTITNIGDLAFLGCTGLTSITIPNSVTSIGDWAFALCKGLTNVKLSYGLTSIGEKAFYFCNSLINVTIPNSVNILTSGAFCGCRSLIEITIPGSVGKLEENVFSGCSSLENVTIQEGVTSIELLAFDGCGRFSNITMPSSVTSIDERAFSNDTVENIIYNGTKAQWGSLISAWTESGVSRFSTITCTDGTINY